MHHYWENLVVFYLYFGGLSAGLFVFSALLTFWGGGKFREMSKVAAVIAPWPVVLGSVMLIFDLGSPLRFWRLFATVQWTSPMSIGSWLLVTFTGVSILHMLVWQFPEKPSALRLGKTSLPLPTPATRRLWRRLLAAVGVPLGLGVGIYTGVLLGAIPARPFWNTPMVAMLFLFSALSTAAALLIMIASGRRPASGARDYHSERRFLYSADIAIILVEILILVPYLLHNALSTQSQARSLSLVLGGPFTGMFWIGFVAIGLVLPLIIELFDLMPLIAGKATSRHHRVLAYLSGVQVLIGGFVLRWVFVHAGQVSTFG